jgi:hypothetical protein
MTNSTQTALITGASSGLGEAFARRLAQDGYHLALTARRIERLEGLAEDLRQKHGIQVEVLPADLSDPRETSTVVDWMLSLPRLDVLINNAGFGLKGGFAENAIERTLGMLEVHVAATVRITRAALDLMLPQNTGTIINVASMAAFFPMTSATYSATKAYLVNFSQGLQGELADTNVYIQALCPGFFYSEFHDTPELSDFKRSEIPGILWLTADQVVKESLQAVGRRQTLCIPGWQYRFAAFFVRMPMTMSIATGVANFLLRNRKKMRQR